MIMGRPYSARLGSCHPIIGQGRDHPVSRIACGERHADQRGAADHQVDPDQKAGICRAQNVTTRPAAPEIRNIQPRKMVTARLASGGTIIAASPSSASTMPSNKNAFQCALTAALISDCNLVMS